MLHGRSNPKRYRHKDDGEGKESKGRDKTKSKKEERREKIKKYFVFQATIVKHGCPSLLKKTKTKKRFGNLVTHPLPSPSYSLSSIAVSRESRKETAEGV